MSAKIINFPVKTQPAAKPETEKSSNAKLLRPVKDFLIPEKNYTLDDLYDEMFTPDYFMLVE